MNETELDEFFQTAYAYWNSLVHTAYQITNDAHGAEDSVQEAMLSLLQQVKSGETIDNPRAWLKKTATYRALNWLRRRNTRTKHETPPNGTAETANNRFDEADTMPTWEAVPGDDAAEDSVVDSLETERLLRLVRKVSGKQPNWSGLMELVAEGYNDTEIAAMQHLPKTKIISSRLFRLRQAIQAELARTSSGEPETQETPRTCSSDWHEEARSLRAAGWSATAIAKHMGKCVFTVYKVLAKQPQRSA